jgi:hypothetical protein
LVINFDVQWEALVVVIGILFVENYFGDHD